MEEEYYPGIEHQELFDYFFNNHDITLLNSEINEVISIVKRIGYNKQKPITSIKKGDLFLCTSDVEMYES